MPFHTRSVGAAFAVLSLTAAAAAAACSSNHDAADDTGVAASDDSADATHAGLSFLVASDLHFGYDRGETISADELAADPYAVDVDQAEPDDEEDDDVDGDTAAASDNGAKELILNQQLAQAMTNVSMKGKPAAKNQAAWDRLGMSNDFRGAIVTGDVTDNGTKHQWQQFLDTWVGSDKLLKHMNVFETAGNHDYRWRTTDALYKGPSQDWVVSHIAARQPSDVHVVDSNNGGSYAIKWDNLLIVNLGVKASNRSQTLITATDSLGDPVYRNTDPFGSLTFLHNVLHNPKINTANTRIILSFHYPMIKDGNDRMTDTEREMLYDTIVGQPVVAILHGHRHISSNYQWCGIPVFEVDTPRSAWDTGYDSSFVAVDLNDKRIKATTVRWRTQSGGVPDVGVAEHCNLKKASDSCWTAEANFADIPVAKNGKDRCKTINAAR